MATKKTGGKPRKTDKQRLQAAFERITELESQAEQWGSRLLDARAERDNIIDQVSHYHQRYDERQKRIKELEEHARSLREYTKAVWRICDLLRDQLVGAAPMPNGRPYRDYVRDKMIAASLGIVPELPETNPNKEQAVKVSDG